jgi:hypothetical protein
VVKPGARLRVAIGAAVGLGVFLVDAFATLLRYVLNPAVSERATAASFAAMAAYLAVFAGAGALAGWLWGMRVRMVRFALVGAIAGAVVWSYLSFTWPLTARASAPTPQDTAIAEVLLTGAVLGALGGLLLFAIAAVRHRA